VIELRRVRGPLDETQLEWVSQLYGPVDHKYRSLDYLRHQLVENPFGWSVHVFALDGDRAVGHCCVVPFRARRGGDELAVGKLEGLAFDPAYRGRRADGGSNAVDLLAALYELAHDNGLPIVFGLAPPGVDRIHVRAGCRQVPVDAPAYVLVADVDAFARGSASRRRRAASALAAGQRTLLIPAATVRSSTRVERPRDEHAELAAAHPAVNGWTISGDDAWEWYVGSDVLRVVEVSGRHGSRALVKLADDETTQIVSWRPAGPGLTPAFALLRCVARLAREHRAPTLRFQPWPGSDPGGALTRACRLAGLVRRPEVDLVVHGDTALDRFRLTPFFYVTF
jgi:hypothetical protein